MSENNNVGFCAYCGQSMVIQTVGEITQAERDVIATEKCTCPEAQSEKRRRERKEKISNFVKRTFDDDIQSFILAAMDMVDNRQIDSLSIKDMYGYSTSIKLNSDFELCVSRKKTEQMDIKF